MISVGSKRCFHQVALHTPVQVSHMDEQVTHLMDLQVLLEDQLYQDQLDSVLHSKQLTKDGAKLDKGFWALPMEEVLPAPQHIPESFRGKSWAQIEQEDEEKVDRLVQQFRRERFTCYFDSESLARYTHLYCSIPVSSRRLLQVSTSACVDESSV